MKVWRARERARRSSDNTLAILERQRIDEDSPQVILREDLADLAGTLDREWASLVLLSLWDTRRDPGDPVRPHVKRALDLLASTDGEGRSRAASDLAKLISSCWLNHEQQSQNLAPIWASDAPGREVHIRITGSSLPTATDAQQLVRGLLQSIGSVAEIIAHKTDPGELFPASEFPHLSRIPISGEGWPIWLGLHLRLSLILRLAQNASEPHLEPIPRGFSVQLYSETGQSITMGPQDILTQLLSGVGDITARPIIEYEGRHWTSTYLLMDSIAPWLLEAIEHSTLREEVISQSFEDKVIHLLRESGFKAGSVNLKGTWETQDGQEHLGSAPPIPGQIDVLAVRRDGLFVLECKSIYAMGNIRNISEKLGAPTHEWRGRLRKKRDWVAGKLGREVDLTMVVTEGIEEYAAESEAETDVALVTYEILRELLGTADRTEMHQ